MEGIITWTNISTGDDTYGLSGVSNSLCLLTPSTPNCQLNHSTLGGTEYICLAKYHPFTMEGSVGWVQRLEWDIKSLRECHLNFNFYWHDIVQGCPNVVTTNNISFLNVRLCRLLDRYQRSDVNSFFIFSVYSPGNSTILQNIMIYKMDGRRKWKNVKNKKKGRGTNLKEPRTKLRRNIMRAHVTRSWNFKRQYLTI